MKVRKLALKRAAAWLMAAAMVTSSVDITALTVSAEEGTQEAVETVVSEAVENTGTTDGAMENPGAMPENTGKEEIFVELPVETVELPELETSARSFSFWSLDNSGKVALRDGNYANWIDRIDATGADYVTTFYNWLVTNSNPETAVTNPESAALFEPTGTNTGEVLMIDTDDDRVNDSYVYKVTEFTGSTILAAIHDVMNANFQNAKAHIVGVYSAFDRDHPEVFWLSGASRMSTQLSYADNGDGTVTYTQPVYFVLKSDEFDIREESYHDNDTLKTAINKTLVANNSARATILAGVPGDADTYETVKYFNEWLTKNNCYNSDVNTAGHDARECTGALNGYSGTAGPVCEAYARAFKVLCDAEGIPCVLVDGEADNGSGDPEAHMWNYVQMEDEKWYAVDVTWNDPTVYGVTSKESGSENENYFLVGSDTEIGGMSFIESHPVSNTVTLSGASFTNGPELEESAYEYASRELSSLTVGGETVDITQDSSGTCWNYDYDTNTLSFTAEVQGDIVASGDLNIAIDGEQLFRNSSVKVNNGDLIISGTGHLKVFGNTNTIGNVTVTNGMLKVNLTGSLYVCRRVTADAISIEGNVHFKADYGMNVRPTISGDYHWKSGNLFETSYVEMTAEDYGGNFQCVTAEHVSVTADTTGNSPEWHLIQCKDGNCAIKVRENGNHFLDENNGYICKITSCTAGAIALVTGGSGEDSYVVPVYRFYGDNSKVENPTTSQGALVWAKTGDTIKLLQDITATGGIMKFQSQGNYFVDLNGCTLDLTSRPFDLTDGSTVTITGAGTFITTTSDSNISAADDFVGYIKTTQNSTTTVYGQVALTENLVIAEGETYNFVNGAKLVLGEYTVTNNGTILVDGVLHEHNNNGAVSAYAQLDDTNHLKLAACLDCPIGHINSSGASEKHTYVGGVCSYCEQVCTHSSVVDGKCENCLKQYAAAVSDGDVVNWHMNIADAVAAANALEGTDDSSPKVILTVYEDYTDNIEIDRDVNSNSVFYLDLKGHTITGDVALKHSTKSVYIMGNGVITGKLTIAETYGGTTTVENGTIGSLDLNGPNEVYVKNATILGNVVANCHVMLGNKSNPCTVKGTVTGGSNSKIFLNEDTTVDGTVTSNGGRIHLGWATLNADTNIVLKDGAQIEVTNVLNTAKITVSAPEGVVAIPGSNSGNLYSWNFVSVDGYTSVKNQDGSISFVCEHGNKDYTVENTTISAKCSSCEKELGSLTLNKPEGLLYDGTAKTATVTGEITGLITPEIVYSGANLVDGKPVHAGDYTASITLEDTSVSVNYTIEAISIENAMIADIPNQTYDGDDITPEPVVSIEDKILVKDTDYTVSYENNVNAGTANITVAGKGNYKDTIVKNFVIDQAETPVITWPVATKLTYGKSLSDSKLEGGSTEYGTFAWADGSVVPGAGETAYTVVFTPSELAVQNYKNMTVMQQNVTVTVDKGTPACEIPEDLTARYGQTLKQITLPEGWSWDAPDTLVGNVGTNEFGATFTPKDTANYSTVQMNLSVKVEPVTLTVTGVTAKSRFYDGTNVVKITGVTISGILDADEVAVNLEGLTGTVAGAKAGDYDAVTLPQLTLIGADAANYILIQPTEAFPTSVSIMKSNASITLKSDVYRKIYGDDAFSIASDITTVGDAKLVYSVSNGLDSKGNPKNADDIVTVSAEGLVTILGSGSVTVTLSMEETANYYGVSKTISIQVMAWDDIPQNGFFIRSMDVETYTGKAIKPEPAVYDGNSETRLEMGRDYTISYKNNKNAYTLKEGEAGFNPKKAPTLIIKGKGNYDKMLTVYFTIQPLDISDDNISIESDDIVVEANGKAQKKAPVVKVNNKKLGKADFAVAYPAEGAAAYTEPGNYPVVITGKGNYTGSITLNLIVAAKGSSLAKATIAKIPAQEFDGVNAVELDENELVVTAKVNGKKEILKKDVHYTVEYVNNEAIGTATVIVKAIEGSGFAGFKKATFKITGASIAKATVTGIENKVYTGSAQELAIKVSLDGALVEGKDYTVTYAKNVNVGTASVTIKGMGKYTGTVKKSFKITPADITEIVRNWDGEIFSKYVKGGAQPSLRIRFNGMILKEGKDYTLTYKDNKDVYMSRNGEYNVDKTPMVTIKGKGNFAGTTSSDFLILSRPLNDPDVPVIMTVADKVISDKKGGYISKVVLTDADGKALKQGVDYSEPVYTMVNEKGETVTLTKEDTAPVGSVITVSVTGMGAYEGGEDNVLTVTYRITAKDFTKAKVKSIQKKYTGKNVELTAEDFLNEDGTSKVTIGGENLVYGKDFEIVPGSYKNNLKKGTASVTIQGCGEYGGMKTVKFKIGARSLWFWWL